MLRTRRVSLGYARGVQRARTPPSPMVTLVIGIAMVAAGALMGRTQVHIHYAGERVLARIASVSHGHGRYSRSSTTVTYGTRAGETLHCEVPGIQGDVGRPMWVRYLPSSPSRCAQDELGPSLAHALFLLGIGLALVVGSYVLYRRAQAGPLRG